MERRAVESVSGAREDPPMTRRLACFALIVLLIPMGAAAQQASTTLRIGVVERPPYAIRTSDGAWLGLGVDLWRLTAEDLGVDWRWVPLEGDAAAALREGRVDLVLPLDATPRLEAEADPATPFHTATLGVAEKRTTRLFNAAQGFVSWRFLQIVATLSVLLLMVGALIWLLERRRNGEQFHRSWARGLGDGFWWAGVTLTTIGYGDKAPVTAAGRAVAMLWMLIGLAVSAGLTAATVTLAGTDGEVAAPEDFRDRAVATVEGTTAQTFLAREGVEAAAFGSVTEALEALDAGQAEIVVAAAPTLAHVTRENGRLDFAVRRTALDPHYVSFVVAQGSELREPVNRAVLERLSGEIGWRLIERYVPEGG
jgi:ABC-type amino acid transport substrate-binding protein